MTAAFAPAKLRPSLGYTHEIDADFVIYRLEEAGATLLALPGTGWTTRLRTSSLEIVRTALESYGWTETRIRPPVPPSEKITRMDEAMGWLPLIPVDRFVIRRVVGARVGLPAERRGRAKGHVRRQQRRRVETQRLHCERHLALDKQPRHHIVVLGRTQRARAVHHDACRA